MGARGGEGDPRILVRQGACLLRINTSIRLSRFSSEPSACGVRGKAESLTVGADRQRSNSRRALPS
jgi:hypothetical protein